jgi:hypothetical protein
MGLLSKGMQITRSKPENEFHKGVSSLNGTASVFQSYISQITT